MLQVDQPDRPRGNLAAVLRARGRRRRGVRAATRAERHELADERPDRQLRQLDLVDDSPQHAFVIGVLRRGLRQRLDERNDERIRLVLLAHVRHPGWEIRHLDEVLERPRRQLADHLGPADDEERLKRLRVKGRPRTLRHTLQHSLRQGHRQISAHAELARDHESARVLLRARGGREASLEVREQPRDGGGLHPFHLAESLAE